MSESRKRYNEEFKRQTVQYIQEQTKTVEKLAQELDIPATTLHQWLGKYGQSQSEYESGLQKLRELERQMKEKDQQLARKPKR
ncbi:Transposase [compost metagenome]